jgi:hypothetical protein
MNIIFTGDLLRINTEECNFDHKDVNTIYNLFHLQITAVTGVKPISWLGRQDGGIFDVRKFYKLNGLNFSLRNWVALSSGAREPTSESEEYFKNCFRDCFVISQECGPLFWKLFKKHNIPCIDMFISPVRFLEDIHWAIKTNVDAARCSLIKYAVDENYIRLCANSLKIYYGQRRALLPKSLLFVGQTKIDLSLLKDGKIHDIYDFKKELGTMFAQYKNVYFKKHPFAQDDKRTNNFLSSFGNIIFTDENIYKMLCDENLSTVVSLSSSVLHEAAYFGKKAIPLLCFYNSYYSRRDSCCACDTYITVSPNVYRAEFWADILRGGGFPILPYEDFGFYTKDNKLRILLNRWWGYEVGKGSIQVSRTRKNNIKKILRQVLSCFVPSRETRRKIRSE